MKCEVTDPECESHSGEPPGRTWVFAGLVVFPVRRQGGVALNPEQAPPLPLRVFHTAEQLVVGVL